jgi:hypothetical protein
MRFGVSGNRNIFGKSEIRLDTEVPDGQITTTTRHTHSGKGTLSPTARSDRAALRDYFVTAFEVLPGLKVAFGDQLIRVHGSAAVARIPSLTQAAIC